MKRTHLILLATALTLTISSCKDQKQGNPTSDADNDNVEMADEAAASDDKATLPERGEFSFATDLLVENDEDGAPIADSHKSLEAHHDVEDAEAEEIADAELESLNLNDQERQTIQKSLERNNGNRSKTAQELGISPRTLYRKLKLYGLTKK